MITLKKILFSTDFSPCSAHAFKYALELAKQHNAEIAVMHVLVLYQEDPYKSTSKLPGMEDMYQASEKQARNAIEETFLDSSNERIPISYCVERGLSAADKILEYATKHETDIIIMGTHGHSAFRHLFLGSVTEKVIRYAPCPIMTIRSDGQHDSSPEHIPWKRILLPLDFSEYSQYAMKYAGAIAKESGAVIEMMHVFEQQVHPAFYATGKTSIFEIMPDISQKSFDAMDTLIASPYKGLAIHKHVSEGNIVKEITRKAVELDIDLIVLATHGLSGIDKFLLGSTTEKVIRKTHCPVLIIKHPEHEFVTDE